MKPFSQPAQLRCSLPPKDKDKEENSHFQPGRVESIRFDPT
jgi:hypothetical protein